MEYPKNLEEAKRALQSVIDRNAEPFERLIASSVLVLFERVEDALAKIEEKDRPSFTVPVPDDRIKPWAERPLGGRGESGM